MEEFLLLGLLLILSGFFSGSETALVALSHSRVKGMLKDDRPGAQVLYKLKSNTTRMLIGILIGNNIVNIAASSLATIIATEKLGHFGPGIAVGLLTFFILIFGEITPKSLAASNAERLSLIVAPLILGFIWLTFPLVWMFEKFTLWIHHITAMEGEPTVTESELISMVEYGEKEGTIETEERQIIQRVFEFNDLQVEDVMTPRHQVFTLNGHLTVKEALNDIVNSNYSRIPLFGKKPDEIDKIVHLRDVLVNISKGNEEALLRDIASEPIFSPLNQPLDDLITILRCKKQHLSIVVDEYGSLLGVVSLEDLLEELVGEIYDESDATPDDFMSISEKKIVVDGDVELRVIEEFFSIELSGKPTDVVSWWILQHLERIPEIDEKFTLENLDVTVQDATSSRINKVIISYPEAPDGAA